MNPSLEFSQKFMVGYNAACKPLCQELKLPQTALDILLFLVNNPEYKTASEPCLGQCGPPRAGGLPPAGGRGR